MTLYTIDFANGDEIEIDESEFESITTKIGNYKKTGVPPSWMKVRDGLWANLANANVIAEGDSAG